MDTNSGSSQNFFALSTTIAFAVFAASRGIETLKHFQGRDEDYTHLRSLALLGGFVTLFALLPLALSEVDTNIQICSFIFFGGGLLLYAYTLYEIVSHKLTMLFRWLSMTLLVATAFFLLLLLANAIYFRSPEVYKVAILWSLIVLCTRFYLVIGVVMARK